MLCQNSVEAWLAKIAIAKAGYVAAPVNVMMATDVIADAFRRVEARLAIVDTDEWAAKGDVLAAAGVEPIMAIGRDESGPAPSFDAFIRDRPASEPDVAVHGDDIWKLATYQVRKDELRWALGLKKGQQIADSPDAATFTAKFGVDDLEVAAADTIKATMHEGDSLLVISYCVLEDEEARNHEPKVILLDGNNQPEG